MPTERFYRLSESKRQLIREAAIAEFARVPFEKVSINQIIHNADISRGSFYTYFSDKQDVLRYIFDDKFEQVKQVCSHELESNGGDYFSMSLCMYDFLVEQIFSSRHTLEMLRNIFSYRENAKLLGLDDWPQSENVLNGTGEHTRWILERIDKSRFRYESDEEFMPLFTMGAMALLCTLDSLFACPDRRAEARSFLENTMDLLRRGACKQNLEGK